MDTSSPKRKARLLVLGDLGASAYRVQQTIDVLAGNLRNGPFELTFLTPRFGYSRRTGSILAKLLREMQNRLVEGFNWIEFFRKALSADLIYILAMNSVEIRRVSLMRRFLRAKIIVDFFVDLAASYEDRLVGRPPEPRQLARFKRIDRLALEMPDVVLVLSRANLQRAAAAAGAGIPKRLEPIPYSVPAYDRAAPSPSNRFRVCWWGIPSALHGLDALLEGIRIAANAIDDLQISFFCAPKLLTRVAELENSVRALGLQGVVSVRTDLTFGNGLADHLARHCDLALGNFGTGTTRSNTSLCQKVVEAMAMGLPVLTRSSRMLREYVSEDSEVFTCEPNALAMSEALIALARDPCARQARAEAGYARWQQTFSPQAFRDRLGQVIESLLPTLAERTHGPPRAPRGGD